MIIIKYASVVSERKKINAKKQGVSKKQLTKVIRKKIEKNWLAKMLQPYWKLVFSSSITN